METVNGIYSDQLQHEFKNALTNTGVPMMGALYFLGVSSGLRISDLLKLKVSDVGRKFDVLEGKTGKLKHVALSASGWTALKTYVNLYALKPSDKLFNTSRQTVYRHFKRAAQTLGLKYVGCHSMRKTYA